MWQGPVLPASGHHPAPGKAQQVQKEKGRLRHGQSCPAARKAMGQMRKQGAEVLEIASLLCRELWLPVPRASPGTRDHRSVMGGKASAGPSPPCSGAAFKEGARALALAARVADLCSSTVLPLHWRHSSTPSPPGLGPGQLPGAPAAAGEGRSCPLPATAGGRAGLRGGTGTQLPLTVTARWAPWLQSAASLGLRARLWVRTTWEDGQWESPVLSSTPYQICPSARRWRNSPESWK